MSMVKNISLTVDEKAHGYAKVYSSLLKSEYQRKRSYASLVALYAFLNSLEKTNNKIQKSMTLFRNPVINEKYEVSDLYVNNWHLDIRIATDYDNVLIPKIHYQNEITPDLYVIIKIDKTLNNAELIGFLEPQKAEKEEFNINYYNVKIKNILNYAEFLDKIQEEKVYDFPQGEHDFVHENYVAFMDKELDEESSSKILRHLFKCSECRMEFCCFTGFEMVSSNVQYYPEILEDNTLVIIGAQQAENTEDEELVYIGEEEPSQEEEKSTPKQEETIAEDTQEQNETAEFEEPQEEQQIETATVQQEEIQPVQDEPEEVNDEVVDILDELFSDDDDFLGADNNDFTQAPQQETNSEFEIIEDDSETAEESSDIENIPNEITQEPEGQPSEEETVDEIVEIDNTEPESVELNESEDEDFSLIEETEDLPTLEEDEEETINFDEEDTIELNMEEDNSNIQEIVTDYDENGEPIYSTVENVEKDDIEITDTEIEVIEDNTEEENFLNEEDDVIEVDVPSEDIELAYDTENNDYETTSPDIDTDEDEENYAENEIIVQTPEEESEEKTVLYDDLAGLSKQNILEDDETDSNDEETENPQSDEDEINWEEEEEYFDEEEYEDEEGIEDSEENNEEDTENDDEDDEEETKKVSTILKSLVIVFCIIAITCGIGFGAFKLFADSNKDTKDDFANQFPQPLEESIPEKGTIDLNELNENKLIKVKPKGQTDVNKIMANAFSQSAQGVSLRKVNWKCQAELFTDKSFKAYLQKLDGFAKLNLRKNILNITDTPISNLVGLKLAIDNTGELKKIAVVKSSGSEQVDSVVLQSIKESFEGENGEIISNETLKSDVYYLEVEINL